MTEQGGWDGTEATWQTFNNPATGKETLFDVGMGTGPYKLVRWDKKVELDFTRNDGYWGAKPSIKNGVYKVVDDMATRKLMLLQGDADIIYVPATNFPEMAKEKGIKIYKDLPSLDTTGLTSTSNINAQGQPEHLLRQAGRQRDPGGLLRRQERAPRVHLRVGRADRDPRRVQRQRHGPGDVHSQGPAVQGREAGEQAARHGQGHRVLQEGLGRPGVGQGLQVRPALQLGQPRAGDGGQDPRGKRDVHQSEVPDRRARTGVVPSSPRRTSRSACRCCSWDGAPTIPIPTTTPIPYLSSSGYFAGRQSYKNATADDLVTKAAVELDPKKRAALYDQLQQIWLDDAIAIIFSQPLRQRFFKDWVKGYYYSPMESLQFELLPILSKG